MTTAVEYPAKKKRPVPEFAPGDDPFKKPYEYLVNRGWRFEGNPHNPNSMWIDPLAPPAGRKKITREIFGYKDLQGNVIEEPDPDRQGQMRPVWRVIRTVEQWEISPEPPLLSREEALQVQINREFASENP